ncbi:MAG TPA: hypothetical protein DCW68_04905 [Rhodospirillaceae bacterium]|nr:MAG: hypothetical protein A2018_02740 [Alphaproteobacteria bacterium GWF2_58_20]HAU29435.1 hypothetical protein [Rhodospirillaceae bacterium]
MKRFLLLAWLCLAPLAARADDASFTVSPVAVDVTAESAAAAKEQAIAQAQRDAFDTVLARMTIPEDRAALPQLTDDDISGFVQNFEVISEKTSPVRYVGSLTVRFSQAAVLTFLREHAVSLIKTRSQPMLILPVFWQDGRLMLWEDENPWREAWDQVSGSGTELMPVVVPLGDIADVAGMSAEKAISGDNDIIRKMADRYHAGGDAVVAIAVASGPQDDPLARLAMQIIRMAPGGDVAVRNLDVLRSANEDDAALMAKATAAVLRELRLAWKAETAVEPIAPRDIDVMALVSSLADWQALEKVLQQEPRIGKIVTVAFGAGYVRGSLTVTGNIEKLQQALVAQGYLLTLGENGYEIRKP